MPARKLEGCRPGKKPKKTKIAEDSIVRFNYPSSRRIDRLFTLVKLSLFLSFSTLFIIIGILLYQNWETVMNIPNIVPTLD